MKLGGLLLGWTLSISVYSQVVVESGILQDALESHITQMPGDSGDVYSQPTLSELSTWSRVITHVQQGDLALAAVAADSIQYDVVQFTDTAKANPREYVLLRKNGTHHWGVYAYFPTYCRDLVIQAPHPLHDFNTGKQGIHVFQRTSAAWLFITGTHRCNHSSFSPCDGTTSVCSGSSESFRISDLAHDEQNLFHRATVTTASLDSAFHYIQLHGFSKQSTDPYLILSNGSPYTPTTDYLFQFSQHLGVIDTSLSFKIAHIDTNWTRLRGFTNTQGRHLNGSPDACDINPSLSTGRFFHVEQEKTQLRSDSIGWSKVARALNQTFSCRSTISLPEQSSTPLLAYPNPAQSVLFIENAPENATIEVYSALGRKCTVPYFQIESRCEIDLRELPSGMYMIYVGNEKGGEFVRIVSSKE